LFHIIGGKSMSIKESRNQGKSVILRIEMSAQQTTFGEVATVVSNSGGDIIAIDVIHTSPESSVRDITVMTTSSTELEHMTTQLNDIPGVNLLHVSDRTFLLHLGGKIDITSKTPIQNRDDLSRVYTPDVARVCM